MYVCCCDTLILSNSCSCIVFSPPFFKKRNFTPTSQCSQVIMPYILSPYPYRASVHIMRLSRWSSVNPLGQAPISISLKTTCLPLPLIDAASIRGKFASQSVQKTILQNNTITKCIISPPLTTAEQRFPATDNITHTAG